VFIGVQNDREWAVLCEQILRRPGLVSDPRFRTNPDRVVHDGELTTIIEERLRGIPAAELELALDQAGIACARLRSPAEFAAHPQLAARDRWRAVGSPGGPVLALLPPVNIEGSEPAMGAVPALGQHTEAIRTELGFTSTERAP
jgi:crotonobetainyl-CoA:carnitine CoA-transferase CaiB-like acyl-CoA transferase